jgi:type I restriction enzyme S subunit
VVTKPEYIQTEAGFIPVDWEAKRLGDVISRCFSGATPRRNRPDFYGGDIRWITSGELRYDVITDTAEKISQDAVEQTNLTIVPTGTFLMAVTGLEAERTRGACAIVGAPSTTNQSCMAVFPTDALVTEYLFYYYVFRGKQLALQYCQGTKQQSYTAGLVKQLPIALPPSTTEQHKIVAVLSDVDALLNGLARLIAKKRDLKQAAMQELLSGKTRLPGFIDEWEVRRLGDFVQIEKGQLITRNTLLPGEIPVIAGGKKPAYHHAVANRIGRTITISASGANAGYVALYNDPIFASDCSTISESDRYCLDFVYYQLLRVQSEIYKLQTGGAQPHIHAKDLNPMTFSFPDLTEQTAIAGVLIDLDAEVAGLEARREKTQALKQGMMQELLTGGIRLVQPEVLHA